MLYNRNQRRKIFKNNFCQKNARLNLFKKKDYLLSLEQSRGKKIKYPSLILINGVVFICLTLLKKIQRGISFSFVSFLILIYLFYLSAFQFISTKRFCEQIVLVVKLLIVISVHYVTPYIIYGLGKWYKQINLVSFMMNFQSDTDVNN